MKRVTTWLVYVATAIWVFIGIWFVWPNTSPVIFAEGDALSPAVVKVGGSVSVTRHFTVKREEVFTITRTLLKGDCTKSCETVDLPSSTLSLKVGESRVQTREFTLPPSVDPGEWRLVFTLQWHDRINRIHFLPLKELSFTVVP